MLFRSAQWLRLEEFFFVVERRVVLELSADVLFESRPAGFSAYG